LTIVAIYAIMRTMGKHEKTLEAMRQRPLTANLRWSDVEKLLIHLGAAIKAGKGSAISVSLHGKKAYFHRPHPGDKADRGAIETALKLLDQAGIE
jgi:hypothetical protein